MHVLPEDCRRNTVRCRDAQQVPHGTMGHQGYEAVESYFSHHGQCYISAHSSSFVSGGGHNPNVGYSSTRDGVLIATHPHMATTTLDENNYARVGPGCKWIDVAEALDPHNRAVVSGRLGVVGAAGLTLGGGLSFLSTEYVSDRSSTRFVPKGGTALT